MRLVVLPLGLGAEHLVGFLVRRGTFCLVELETPLPSERVSVGAWMIDDGPPMLVANIYGFSNPSAVQQAALGGPS